MAKVFTLLTVLSLFFASCAKQEPLLAELTKAPTISTSFHYPTSWNVSISLYLEGEGFPIDPIRGTPLDYEIEVKSIRQKIASSFVSSPYSKLTLSIPASVKTLWVRSRLTGAEVMINLERSGEYTSKMRVYRVDPGRNALKEMSSGTTFLGRNPSVASVHRFLHQLRPAETGNLRDTDRDGVDDQFDLFPFDPSRAFILNEPAFGYNTLVYEDLWPSKGDYDFNDLVLQHRMQWVLNGQNQRVEANGELVFLAMGAGFPNGLAMQLLAYDPQTVQYSRVEGERIASAQGLLADPAGMPNTRLVAANIRQALGNYYTNMDDYGTNRKPDTLRYAFALQNPATEFLRTDFFLLKGIPNTTQSDRSVEIHIAGRPSTLAANTSFFGTNADRTNQTTWYQDDVNMPWGIELFASPLAYTSPLVGQNTAGNWVPFRYPKSKVDIRAAYPNFTTWAASKGAEHADWMMFPVESLVYWPNLR